MFIVYKIYSTTRRAEQSTTRQRARKAHCTKLPHENVDFRKVGFLPRRVRRQINVAFGHALMVPCSPSRDLRRKFIPSRRCVSIGGKPRRVPSPVRDDTNVAHSGSCGRPL